MPLLPSSESNINSAEANPGKTYAIIDEKIAGYIDGKDSIKQAISLMLNTERYKHLIYTWNYGHELNSLVGKDKELIEAELPRIIQECLTQDDRISEVRDFSFLYDGDSLTVNFYAVTSEGIVESEVSI